VVRILHKTIIIGIITLLLTISIIPTQARTSNQQSTPQQTFLENDNIVADIEVTWDSFLHRLKLKEFGPNVTINQSITKDFYFPEINGSILSINFTVTCKHKLLTKVILPRFTQVYLAVSYNGTYILLTETENIRCKSLDWEYINLTVASSNGFIPLQTNGENITLNIEVGAYFFIFGSIQQLTPVTIHPVPQ
jgi:hypothetical protein